jgi:hypothetical protein
MSDQENMNRAQAFVNELNQGNMGSIQTYIADEFFAHVLVGDEPTGVDGWPRSLSNPRYGTRS